MLGVSGISLADPLLPASDNVTLTLAVADGTVTLSTAVTNGLTTSEITGNGTGSVTVSAPLASINATLATTSGLSYTPTSGVNGTDTLVLTGSDSLGNNGTGSIPLVVAGPLTITAPSTQQIVKPGSTLGVSGISVADPSLPASDIVTVTVAATHGAATLSTSVTNGIAASQVTGNGTDSVTITAPLAAINATLATASGLTYAPTSGFNGSDTLSLAASDALTNNSTGRVSLLAVGPLTVTAPSGQQAAVSRNALSITGVSLNDPSLPATNNVTLTLKASHGAVMLSTAVAGGITSSQVTGNGTSSVTITAPLTAINATLAATNGLTYTGTSGYSEPDNLALSASDTLGNSDTASVSLNVALGNTATLSGIVYEDSNGNGMFDAAESGLSGIIVTLTGTNSQNSAVGPLTVQTASDGSFKFENLPRRIKYLSFPPAELIDGKATVGSQSGTAGSDVISGITVVTGAGAPATTSARTGCHRDWSRSICS